jgi:voltage-gated potassium channel Kch
MAEQTGDPTQGRRRQSIRRFWQERVLEQWRDHHWLVIGALWLMAVGLGYAGFARYYALRGEERPFWDLLYLTLQLFTLESGSVPGPMSWELELARWLAPAVAAYTAIQTLALIFREKLQLVRVGFIRDHVVICGLGRKGHLLAQAFRARGDRVVVLEQDEGNDLIEQCREIGAIVMIGNATSPALLRKAGVYRARYLISVSGDDGINAEVAVRACELVGSRRGKALACILHIVDPQLCTLLKEREIETGEIDAYRLEFFNVFDNGARALLKEYPAFDAQKESRPHILVVGLGRLGESLVVHAARSWHAGSPAGRKRLRMTIIDREAERRTKSLCLRYPQLATTCEFNALSMDIRWPEFQEAKFLFDRRGRCIVTKMYVCLDDDALGLSAALSLRQRTRDQGILIMVRTEQDAGLAMLMRGIDGQGEGFESLRAFGLLDRTCQPDLLLGGTHEIIARAIHEEYVRYREALDLASESDPATVPWADLSDEYQESCRRQADHVGFKLRTIGCGIAPLTDWDAELFEFTSEEVERMAQMEHERWMDERHREGWQTGPRDWKRKTNPYLVSWGDLAEEAREMTRDMVRGLPAFLAGVDLQVYRLKQQERE